MNATDSSRVPQKAAPGFPLLLCGLAAAATGAGLSAAVLGIQWGADSPQSDALEFAWVYVNTALVALLFLLWPAAVLRDTHLSNANYSAPSPTWELPAIATAVVPAVTLAAWMSAAPTGVICRTLALQGGFAIFMAGLLAWRGDGRSSTLRAFIAGTAAILVLLLPMVVYVQMEFLGQSARAWQLLSPAMVAAEAARGGTAPALTWVAIGYALAGAALGAAKALSTPSRFSQAERGNA